MSNEAGTENSNQAHVIQLVKALSDEPDRTLSYLAR